MTADTNWLSLKINKLLSKKKRIHFHILSLSQLWSSLHLSGRPYEKSGNFCGRVNGQRDSYPNYEPLYKNRGILNLLHLYKVKESVRNVGNIYTESMGGPPYGGILVNGVLLHSLWDIITQVTSANPISHTRFSS